MHVEIANADNRIHRGRKASTWRDPKLLIGVALIVFSVLLTAWIVERARGGEEVYQLAVAVPAGEKLSEQSLMVVKARTGSDAYLSVGDLPENAVAVRSLSAGELLPRAAVSDATDLGRRQLVISVANRIPSTVEVGESVELWAVKQTDVNDSSASPQLVCADAMVLKVLDSSNGLSASRNQNVEISVPQEDLSEVLSVTGSKSQLTIVPKG